MLVARMPQAGDLLVAAVDSGHDLFEQTVVLILDKDETGTLGVILNKLAEVDLAAVLPQWSERVSPPQEMFSGGPLSPDGAVCLASCELADEPPGWRRLFGDVGLLHLDTPVELVDGAFGDLRIYAGYAAWEPRQLENELIHGAWYLVNATYDDVFTTEPDDLWRRVLRRQGGDLGLLSTWTDEPQLN